MATSFKVKTPSFFYYYKRLLQVTPDLPEEQTITWKKYNNVIRYDYVH